MSKLAVIIPVTRGEGVYKSVDSVFEQLGFSEIEVIISGNSTIDNFFCEKIKKKYKNKKLHVCISANNKFPGAARNDGLNYLNKKKSKPDYVIFIDDDVVIPKDYCLTLKKTFSKNKSCAVIGRLVSKPKTFFRRIIDFSNFWWLQADSDVLNRGWMVAAATFVKFSHIKKLRFLDNVRVNEDTIFFNELAFLTNKYLSVCSGTTADHFHSRHSLMGVVFYQFNNGRLGVTFASSSPNLFKAILEIKTLFLSSYHVNGRQIKNKYFLLIGILFSFIFFELGIQFQSLKNFLNIYKFKFKNKLNELKN